MKQSKTERMYRKQGTDEEWERQVREELERKKKGAVAEPVMSEAEREALDALLAHESSRRSQLKMLKARLSSVLLMLKSVRRDTFELLYFKPLTLL